MPDQIELKNSMSAAAERLAPFLEPSRLSEVRAADGFLDLLPASPEVTGVAQTLMVSRALPTIYERFWRPVFRLGRGGRGGISDREEYHLAAHYLGLSRGAIVYDVACGPGNFTPRFGKAVGSNGLVIGVDFSATMLRQAAGTRGHESVEYLRADALDLPFLDSSADAVGCFAALWLIPDPMHAIVEMVRVLKPGGQIALLTSYFPVEAALSSVNLLLGRTAGLRAFGRREITGELSRLGLVDIQQRTGGVMQIVGARKPE